MTVFTIIMMVFMALLMLLFVAGAGVAVLVVCWALVRLMK